MANAKIIEQNSTEMTVQITFQFKKSMMEGEEAILEALNGAGHILTGAQMSQFDTDGAAIVMGAVKWTSKGKFPKTYETPYGETVVERHVYQTNKGGRIFCPLERDARVILTATPKFAKMVSSKYAEVGITRVVEDLASNHQRKLAKSFLQNICDAVGTVAFAKEESWDYALPEITEKVATIAIGLDGACVNMADDGYRQAMVGTIALFDEKGERQHTVYTAASPEQGKKTFLVKMDEEIERIQKKYPKADYVGLADGAKDNWAFLKEHTHTQILDFWHATEYLAKASEVMFPLKKDLQNKAEWLSNACHTLKYTPRGAKRLLKEMESFSTTHKLKATQKEILQSTITYFANNLDKMAYAEAVEANLPIGSGVTEAACKAIVKQRLCASGMRWGPRGAAVVLTLRCLAHTLGRWDQFWGKIDRYGLSLAS